MNEHEIFLINLLPDDSLPCFPGMVNCANIDWFFPWPEQALYAVASVFISPDVSMLQNKSDIIVRTGPHSAVGNMSDYRCASDCRSRGREFDPGPVPYFRGD